MKVIIAGGRDYQLNPDDYERLDRLHQQSPITEVVCGMARGADTCGKFWAEERGIPVKEFPAKWKQHGRSAGPKRNAQMAEYADAAVLFPGGRGTENMFQQASKNGLQLFDWR